MKVADIMETKIDYVTENNSVKDVSRLIFGRDINGVPVCDKKKKVIGFVTEKDILAKFYPSVQEYMENPLQSSDFVEMEARVNEILNSPVKEVMSKTPRTVSPDTPVMKAQSIMQVAKVGRLPVVDEHKTLIGMLTKNDIFRAIVGRKMEFSREERFYDWLSDHYDTLMDWKRRCGAEIPSLTQKLHAIHAESILDIGSSTGEHSIALAKKGFKVYGIDTSKLMIDKAEKKRKQLPEGISEKISFLHGQYSKKIKQIPEEMDAALFLGNALPHVIRTDANILKEVSNSLKSKNAMMVFQIINFNKELRKTPNVKRVSVHKIKDKQGFETKISFVGFYSQKTSKILSFVESIFTFDGYKWNFLGMNTTEIVNISEEDLTGRLQKLGFNRFEYYGASLYDPLFDKKFDPENSEYLVVVARR